MGGRAYEYTDENGRDHCIRPRFHDGRGRRPGQFPRAAGGIRASAWHLVLDGGGDRRLPPVRLLHGDDAGHGPRPRARDRQARGPRLLRAARPRVGGAADASARTTTPTTRVPFSFDLSFNYYPPEYDRPGPDRGHQAPARLRPALRPVADPGAEAARAAAARANRRLRALAVGRVRGPGGRYPPRRRGPPPDPSALHPGRRRRRGRRRGAAGGRLRARRPAATDDKLNVLLLIIDSLRPDHVGAYGAPIVQTPNIDALAARGLRFNRAFPEAMVTIPARRSIFTSQRIFPFRNHVVNEELGTSPGWQAITDNETTWTSVLRREGYWVAQVSDNPHTGFTALLQAVPALLRPLRVGGRRSRGSSRTPESVPLEHGLPLAAARCCATTATCRACASTWPTPARAWTRS